MAPSALAGSLSGKRILVVEDEALLAMMIEDDLRDAGAEVVGMAGHCEQALDLIGDAIATGGLDAAVLDVNLCGEAALPVADALAERGVPFLFATGYSSGPVLGRHAAVPVLEKPFSRSDLVEAVRLLVGSPRRLRPSLRLVG